MNFSISIVRNAALLLLACIFSFNAYAQKNGITDYGEIHGNFQVDAVYLPEADSLIGFNTVPPEKFLMNGFGNVIYTKGNFRAGARYEAYLNPLPGFDARYKGQGIPYRYAGYTVENLDVTLGSFYEQFGNGLVFRSYEERALGFDNAMDGIRLKYMPVKGLYTKAFIGKQRQFFTTGAGLVRGIDGELHINELLDSLLGETNVSVGGSFISRYQADTDPDWNLPENVAAWATRFNVTRGKVALTGEYAYKINDPSLVNGMIYKPGNAIFLMASYSQKGLGASLSVKRIDNMNFRSDRNAQGNALTLNYLPALTKQHTYMLATFYPYATQPNGEQGVQAEVVYTIKKGTVLGGDYGTTVILNASAANSIDTNLTNVNPDYGYESDFTRIGRSNYFRDYNVEVSRKFNKKVKVNLFYAYQEYNKNIIQGLAGYPRIYSQIAVIDVTYKFTSTVALRTELQSLTTEEDKGSWAAGLLELTVVPHWFITAIDQYNYGNKGHEVHYYFGAIGYVKGAKRISLGYGRQREGIYCVGGICRNVPATSGFSMSVSTSF